MENQCLSCDLTGDPTACNIWNGIVPIDWELPVVQIVNHSVNYFPKLSSASRQNRIQTGSAPVRRSGFEKSIGQRVCRGYSNDYKTSRGGADQLASEPCYRDSHGLLKLFRPYPDIDDAFLFISKHNHGDSLAGISPYTCVFPKSHSILCCTKSQTITWASREQARSALP